MRKREKEEIKRGGRAGEDETEGSREIERERKRAPGRELERNRDKKGAEGEVTVVETKVAGVTTVASSAVISP